MPTLQSLTEQAQKFGPTRPMKDVVSQMNIWFHEYEAQGYDDHHDEIFDVLPGIWAEMLGQAFARLPGRSLKVLDFGCGTGFASAQVLQAPWSERVSEVTCYDLSPQMLDGCRQRFAGEARVYCSNDFQSIQASRGPFDLLLTNSILHHLHDPAQVLNELKGVLAPDAVWVNGHEPSNRFLKNSDCVQVLARYQQTERWNKLLSPMRVGRAVARRLGLVKNPYRLAAERAVKEGLFQRRPSESLVSELVDFHVPRTTEDALQGRGFDVAELSRDWNSSWRLLWSQSYNFLGPVYEGAIPLAWQQKCQSLKQQYPQDGANYCALWQRV